VARSVLALAVAREKMTNMSSRRRPVVGPERLMPPDVPEADSSEKAAADQAAPALPGASRRGQMAFWAILAAIILAGAAVVGVVAVVHARGGPQLARRQRRTGRDTKHGRDLHLHHGLSDYNGQQATQRFTLVIQP
jgi:hypothetical protein